MPLLPKVVSLGLGVQGGGVASKQEGVAWSSEKSAKGGGRGRFYGTRHAMKSPTSPLTKVAPKLSVVNEGVEATPPPPPAAAAAAEMTASHSSMSSKGSTLKNGDFEADSLDQEVVLFSTNSSVRTHPHALINGGVVLPHPPRNKNLVVNYADPHGSGTLSPIWNQYFRTDSETSTNSEYITSYVGELTPLPSVLSPDYKHRNQVVGGGGGGGGGAPSGGGGARSDSDPDHGRDPSSGESGGEGAGEAKDGCLKWKRGRLLGKGAYGKVWEGLLSSARMIAVKEVELDTDSHERAQAVSTHPLVTIYSNDITIYYL